MTKTDLIDLIAQRSHQYYSASVSKVVIAAVLDTLADVASTELWDGNDLPLPGLGKFTVKQRPARNGRNPATGQAMTIAAHAVIKFVPGKALKDGIKQR